MFRVVLFSVISVLNFNGLMYPKKLKVLLSEC